MNIPHWLPPGRQSGFLKAGWRKAAWVVAGSMPLLALVSCETVRRTVVMPPRVPGATFVGSDACSDCHVKFAGPMTINWRDFHLSSHARLRVSGDNDTEIGCETCHGPGSKHVDTGGAHGTIINTHKSPEVCFECHQDMRGYFRLPYRHPVMEGQIACGDCHEPHRGPAYRGGGTLLATANEVCIGCHKAQQGPYVFEHEAMREGCVMCHDPHGSVNAKMLHQRNANLCLKCHVSVATSSIQIGGLPHSALLQRGACWTGGCHEAVHGSQVSTSLRY